MLMSFRVTLGLLLLFITSGCDVSPSGDYLVERGAVYYEQNDYAAAIGELQKSLDKPRSNFTESEVLTLIGNCYVELGEYEEAIRFHNKAIKADPKYHKAYVNKGIVCRIQGDFDEAEKLYSKALELEPEYAELHVSLGALYIHQEQYDKAVAHLEKGVELDDTLAVGHSNLALAYATVGRFADAKKQLKKAILQGYDHPEDIQMRIEAFQSIAKQEEESSGAEVETSDADDASQVLPQ